VSGVRKKALEYLQALSSGLGLGVHLEASARRAGSVAFTHAA
jgi:hypothetical protein